MPTSANLTYNPHKTWDSCTRHRPNLKLSGVRYYLVAERLCFLCMVDEFSRTRAHEAWI